VELFAGRKLVIATKHGKESVIAPRIEEALGVQCFVPKRFDSDLFGTFTGEVERLDDPIATARKKCLYAMEKETCDMAIASEGSFGAHPTLYFVPADDEFLLFIDKKNQLEILVREVSTATNFDGAHVQYDKEIKAFAEKVKFPAHAIIARRHKDDAFSIEKNIHSWDKLLRIAEKYIAQYGSFYLETDMRAMNNPSRMKVIELAAIKLIDKINSLCPSCKTPGFGITEAKTGLPCAHCNSPTHSVFSHIYQCAKCNHQNELKFPNNIKHEDPMYCDLCNP
jgi:hypothetical protein